MALGAFDDMWWGWITDFGLPGPDRGEGGRFLLVPPDYDGPLPDSGYHLGHSRTSRVLVLGRSFLTDNDPAPTVATIKRTMKVYPYSQGSFGTSVATLLKGGVHPDPPATVPETVFVEGSGKAFNTVPPSDFGFFELLNELVQDEPAGSTDPELMGQLAAIGIVKGKPFAPDERMRAPSTTRPPSGRDLAGAAPQLPRRRRGSGTTTSRRGSTCCGSAATRSRRRRRSSPPRIKPFPANGVRTLHSRTSFLYAATGVSPAMCMRLTGLGSQYLMAVNDADGNRWTARRPTG